MFPPYKPYIPKGISEIMDYLGMMMLDLEMAFYELNEGLRLIRGKLGEERYRKLMEMSDRMRAHFEADPENKTDDTLMGRDIISEMEAVLMQGGRKS